MRRAIALLLVVHACAARAAEAPPASPLLPFDHWSVKAAQRLYEVGLAPDWLPAQRAVPLLVVGRTLAAAAAGSQQGGARYAALAHAWNERFRGEFLRAGDAGDGGVSVPGAALGAGFALGAVRQSVPASPQSGFIRLTAPRDSLVGDGSASVLLGRHVAAGARLRMDRSDVDVGSLEAVAAFGPVALSVGRASVGYGPNEVGGVVGTGAASADRIELMTTAPVRLPWALRALGDFALDFSLSRFLEARHPYRPLLWGLQLQWRPHPRLTIGARRAMMFGGAKWEGISAHDIQLSLLGLRTLNENNVYSVSAEYRLPTHDLLPLTVKVDWGTDDNPGAAVQWPGLVAGIRAPMLGELPASLGFEYAYFGRGLFGYHDPFPWYGHHQYTGGWVTGQTPLGDPLGGNGRAFRLIGSADALGGLLRLATMAWIQDRFPDNLYAPAASGRSVGGQGEAEVRRGHFAVGIRGGYERGTAGWSRGDLRAEATLFF